MTKKNEAARKGVNWGRKSFGVLGNGFAAFVLHRRGDDQRRPATQVSEAPARNRGGFRRKPRFENGLV